MAHHLIILLFHTRSLREKIKENKEKIKLNNQLPYLVGNIVEVLDVKPEEEEEEDGATADLDSQRQGKCVVLKTSTRQTIFLPVVGLVEPSSLRPGDLVGVNKDSYLVLDTLPAEYDSRVKAMEVDEKPTEDYSDIGGLDKQIQVGFWYRFVGFRVSAWFCEQGATCSSRRRQQLAHKQQWVLLCCSSRQHDHAHHAHVLLHPPASCLAGAGGGCGAAHPAQGPLREAGHPAAQGRAAVRRAGHGQDAAGARLRGTGEGLSFQIAQSRAAA